MHPTVEKEQGSQLMQCLLDIFQHFLHSNYFICAVAHQQLDDDYASAIALPTLLLFTYSRFHE